MWWIVAPCFAASTDTSGMAGHFEEAALTLLAVAMNDEDGARAHAKALIKAETAPEQLQNAARAVMAKIGNPKQSGVALAELAETCATCHRSGGRGPRPHDTDVVPGSNPIDRHVMASTFLWIGLITPAEEPWKVGLAAIEPPVDPDASNKRVDEMAETFSGLVEQARAAKAWDQRADLFGQMIPTCTECHLRTGAALR
ncbi:MAG: hypothetical protein ABMB14_18085 [Myxococcota bacterium]